MTLDARSSEFTVSNDARYAFVLRPVGKCLIWKELAIDIQIIKIKLIFKRLKNPCILDNYFYKSYYVMISKKSI